MIIWILGLQSNLQLKVKNVRSNPTWAVIYSLCMGLKTSRFLLERDIMENSNQYDEYLASHVKHYMVTEFLGRGKYEKTAFNSLHDARGYQSQVKVKRPNARIAVYGISFPPHSHSKDGINIII